MGLSKRAKKLIFIPLGIIVLLALIWTGIAFIGRVRPGSVIPGTADLRLTVHNPMSLIDGVLSHESLREIASVPELAAAAPVIDMLRENPLLENGLIRMAGRGTLELALILPQGDTGGAAQSTAQIPTVIAVWDMGFLSPLLRILPWFTRFISVPDLYYVQAGGNSRFEYRLDDMTLFIGHYRNLLFVTNNSREFSNRTHSSAQGREYTQINPSSFDAAFLLSPELISSLLAAQTDEIAAIMSLINFNSPVEAGLSVYSQKLEFNLAADLSSANASLQSILGQRGSVPNIIERFPDSSQYATVLSAGTLDDLLQAAMVFSGPELSETLRQAHNMSRTILRMPLEELLFSWSGNEFAVFGIEGRPHPVYAIQVSHEEIRQDVFNRAFRSIVLSENVRLNLDGTRIPQIEVPGFLQSLLRLWGISLPSPYYTVHDGYLLISESAETLLAAMRAIQRNEVLPRTSEWRSLRGTGSSAASAFTLYYSLDVSVPFFLRESTALSSFLRVYRQGLLNLNIDRGQVSLSLNLIPGSGSGITLLNSIAINYRQRPSNQIYGASLPAAQGGLSRIYISAGETVFSVNPLDNSIRELTGQGEQWIIPAEGVSGFADAGAAAGAGTAVSAELYAWVVSDRGRVTLVDSEMEAVRGFPLVTGLRISSPPVAYNGMLYLACEDGRVHAVDQDGNIRVWETSFFTALRSPPSFFSLPPRGGNARHFAAAYPKGFFGEIWLLDTDGRALPGWPASLITDRGGSDYFSFDSGLGFGSPLLFAHNGRLLLAFISQAGDLFIFDEYASVVGPFPIVLEGVFYQQPVFDGEFLWLVSAEGVLFRVSMEGEILQHTIRGFSVMEEGHISFYDYDRDGVPEIFVTGEGNALHGFTRHFRSLETFPLPMWGRPYIETRGGRTEIYGMGMDSVLYRWQFR